QGDDAILYGDLELEAVRLARRLAEMGVGPEVRVGLLASGVARAVAALGVLKASGASVPLAPTEPRERLLAHLAAPGTAIVVVRGPLPAGLGEALAARAVRLVDLDAEAASGAGRPPSPPPPPEALAAVVGPEGAMLSHRAAVQAVREAMRLHRAGPDSRIASFADPTSATWLLDLLVAMASGGAL